MSYCIYHFKFIAVGFLWFLKRIFNKFSNTSSLFLSEPSQKGFLSCAVTMACGFVRASRSARMAAATRQQTKGSRHMRLLGSVCVCVCRALLCVFLWKAKKEKKTLGHVVSRRQTDGTTAGYLGALLWFFCDQTARLLAGFTTFLHS